MQPNENEQEIQVITSDSQDLKQSGKTVAAFYSGPLPPASEFEKYERVLPGTANRIIEMAEKQSAHRHFIENVIVVVESSKSLIGTLGALVIVLAGMYCGAYLIMKDKPTAGFVAILFPLASIVGAYLYQEVKKNNDIENKD